MNIHFMFLRNVRHFILFFDFDFFARHGLKKSSLIPHIANQTWNGKPDSSSTKESFKVRIPLPLPNVPKDKSQLE